MKYKVIKEFVDKDSKIRYSKDQSIELTNDRADELKGFVKQIILKDKKLKVDYQTKSINEN